MGCPPSEQAGWTVERFDRACDWVDNYLRWGVLL